ncbi:MAG: PAS domain S-box protein, partial [Bacteroidia bacterium]
EQYKQALKEFQPDVIICDHSLPSFTSTNALEILKERKLRIPFILVTATISEEFVVTLMKNGIDDYILKDRLQRLPSAVINALEKVSAESDKDRYFKKIISQEKRFRALIENLCEAILLVDKESKITYQSPSATTLTGFEDKEAINKSIFDFLYPDDLPPARALFDKSLSMPQKPLHGTFRLIRKDKSYIHAEGTITNLLADENVTGFIINFRDVTERVKAEKLLQKSEANLRTIYNNTSISYILLDKKLKVMEFNGQSAQTFLHLSGQSIAEGKDFMDLLPVERREFVRKKFEEVTKGKKEGYEQEHTNPGGKPSWFKIDILPVIGNDGKVFGFIASSEDITERKKTELEREEMTADLIQHNKNLEQFAYIISHNLRSPVANIIGLSNMIKSMPDMSREDFNRCIDGLEVSVKKLDDTIIDLNFILQIRREINEKKETIHFSSLVRDIVTSINNLVEKEKIVIRTNFDEIDEFFTIKSYLNSIFFNLISNSIKYRDPSRITYININSKLENRKLVLIFEDNGMGIDMDLNRNKIFGLYKKFHPQIEGKGMGLYMVKTQVEILGGKIDITSEVGVGTAFRMEFKI